MIILSKDIFDQIVQHAIREFPDEACGILAGRQDKVGKAYIMTNSDKSPQSFSMDSGEQLKVMKDMRNLGLDFLGTYHSHVASQAYPSSRDVELAFYPEASYAIVTLQDKINPSVRSFKIKDGHVSEEEVRIE